MITIHHLGVSQSDRIVWLMEELNLPYKLKWYDRKDGLAPPEYLALHPASTAPVIEDDDRVLTESAAILEYICHRYAGGKLTVGPTQPNYSDYLYWMHFNNNVQGLFFAKLALGGAPDAQAQGAGGFIKRREDEYFGYLDQRLGAVTVSRRARVHLRRHHGDVQSDRAAAVRRPRHRRSAEREGVREAHRRAAGVPEGDEDRRTRLLRRPLHSSGLARNGTSCRSRASRR